VRDARGLLGGNLAPWHARKQGKQLPTRARFR
jgi:hypothetical protein